MSVDFCSMFSNSCNTCLRQTVNPIFNSKCLWVNDACISETQFKYNPSQRVLNSLSHCDDLRFMASTSTIRVTTISDIITTTTASQPNVSHSDNDVFKTENLPDSFDNFAIHSPSFLNYEIDSFKTKPNNYNNQYNTHKSILIIVAVFALFTALVLGIIFGCVLKALYFKKFINFFRKKIAFSQPKEKKLKIERSQIRLSANNEASKIRMARSFHDIIGEKTSARHSNSATTDDDSLGSNKSNCVFIYSSGSSKLNQKADIKGNYFTIQNDYGIFTKNQSDYFKLATSNTITDATNLTNETRLSSTASSVDSYALINQINSQTCLLNTSKDVNNKFKSINENSETARYPHIKQNSQQNSSDDTAEFTSRINKKFSFTSSSTPSSYSPATAIESTCSSVGSQTPNEKYLKHHHTKRKSLNVYQTKSPNYLNQEIIAITSSPNDLVEVNSNIYLKPNIHDFYQNNSYV